MARLYIGSYIIDSADSSSSSTTSGTQLDLDYDEPLEPVIEDNPDGTSEYRWPLFYAVVTAASESALKTAVDAVEAGILNCNGKTITYEETNGTTLFTMDTTTWPQCSASVKKYQDQLTCELAFSFIGRRAGTVASGAADETGQIGPITWEYEVSAGGLAGMVARATFGATTGTGARANAVAWVNKMRSTANYSAECPWLSTALRLVGAIIEFDQKANLASVAETSYDPARVTLTYRELHATLAADSSWPTYAVAANWNVSMTERGAMNVRSGSSAGYDLVLFGDITLKTQGNATWDSNENSGTKIADADLYSSAQTAVNAIITQFNAVYVGLSLTQWGQPVINIDPVQGIAGFAVKFTAGATVLEWEEHCVVKNIFQKRISRSTDGSDWKYEQQGGPIRILQHNLRIVALTPTPYKPPALSGNWDEQEAELEPTIEVKFNNDVIEYHTQGAKTWRWLNSGPTSLTGYTSSMTPKGIDSIGDGLI